MIHPLPTMRWMTKPYDNNPDPPVKSVQLPVPDAAVKKLFTSHARRWEDFHYVYPVISRRSGGLSVGINLNIDKACNFDCIYCCVDRSVKPVRQDTDLAQLKDELDKMLNWATTGQIWTHKQFMDVPQAYRHINDIAFSGDGEPTTYPGFEQACRIVADLKQACHLDTAKIIVITNAAVLERPLVQRALKFLDAHNGEVWAKLDAGTQDYYRQVDRTNVPLKKILSNILACGRARPIVIQSLFMAVQGQPLPVVEFESYLERLSELLAARCQIKNVQLYTTARQVAQKYVTPLTDAYLDQLLAKLHQRLPTLAAQVYYGVS